MALIEIINYNRTAPGYGRYNISAFVVTLITAFKIPAGTVCKPSRILNACYLCVILFGVVLFSDLVCVYALRRYDGYLSDFW